MNEDQLQIAVVDYLRFALPSDAVVFHPANGGSRNKIEAAKLKRMGVAAGVPDLVVCYRSVAYFIELKTPKGRLSVPQTEMGKRLEHTGFDVGVCRSVEDVRLFLTNYGSIPLRARVSA